MIISNFKCLLVLYFITVCNWIRAESADLSADNQLSLDCKNINGNDISTHVPIDYNFIFGNNSFILNLCNSTESKCSGILCSSPKHQSGQVFRKSPII